MILLSGCTSISFFRLEASLLEITGVVPGSGFRFLTCCRATGKCHCVKVEHVWCFQALHLFYTKFAEFNILFIPPPGVNTVTSLVESKKAQLVVIAHDVDPIEVSSLFGWGIAGKSCCGCCNDVLNFFTWMHSEDKKLVCFEPWATTLAASFTLVLLIIKL